MINFFRRVKKLSPLEGYNKWAKTYHSEANPIKQLSDEFIATELPELEGKSVLDAGCGTGKFCTMAVQGSASFVKGIDLSPVMIEQAKTNCPEAKFECADLSTVKLEQFDIVICGLVLGHIEEFVLSKLLRALKPGGHIVVTDFHPTQTMKKAKRTFRENGRTFEISHTLHRLDEYFDQFKRFNIKTVAFKEPLYNNSPVIFGIHGTLA